MIALCPPNQCTGCAACEARCPRNAIVMREDTHGFRQPVIQRSTCTECGLCRSSCPVLTEVPSERWEQPEVYAGWSLNNSIRTDSSSGGAFSVLAEAVMHRGGKVFAAAFGPGLILRHREVTGSEDLHAFRGSKYLQSSMGRDTYLQIAAYAKRGVQVMFVGTPCQVAGLRCLLGGGGAQVLMCELVCHGAPSQRLFDNYLKYLRDRGYSGFTGIDFRDRTTSSRSTLLTYDAPLKNRLLTGADDYYQQAFIRGLISREACYACKFARLPRTGDITLGDFWGLGLEQSFHHDTTGGVSLILANSPQGVEMLRACEPELFLERRPLSEAVRKNPRVHKAGSYSPLREAFLSDLEFRPIHQLMRQYRLHGAMTIRTLIRSCGRRVLGARGLAWVRAARRRSHHA